MKAKELRKLSLQDLKKKEEELREELLRLRFKKKVEGLPNPMQIRNTRRYLARVLTLIREKELRGEA
ncbi:MAG: 50S ribosomal protein L29 [Aquificota bacterium]|jgi:large subunit ribosomal protein L29|nr:50S ribosomal protein L29 [Aquificaceae bacterium]MDM7266877.1 50S ribosomal protein L29 [Aquificaceae bacterium]QWK13094.1 MAG: 50S ribosomal protein L29 [Aquificota bacterium]HAV40240.1 50S ribosomal protein L29 [Aquificaceae bacterium]HCO39117.1 50S ribosomal protein L29 [Aquificaceae bacterium]